MFQGNSMVKVIVNINSITSLFWASESPYKRYCVYVFIISNIYA